MAADDMARLARTNKRIIGIFGGLLALLVTVGLTVGLSGRQVKAPSQVAPAKHYSAVEARAELRRLLDELDDFRGLIGFHEAGFGAKAIPQAKRWREDVGALQVGIANDTNLPVPLRVAPGELVDLAMAYKNSQGQETDKTLDARAAVEEALNK